MSLDQLVDITEAPRFRERVPCSCEARVVAVVLRAQQLARVREARLVLGDANLDLAQPPHPGERPAERTDGCIRGGTEVAQTLAERRARNGTVDEIGLERLALCAVARCLRTPHALSQDRFPLSSFHDASVPAWGRSRARSSRSSPTPSAGRAD